MTTLYSDSFTNIEQETIEEAKKLVKTGIWKKDVDVKIKVENVKEFLKSLSDIYGIEAPRLLFDKSEDFYRMTGGFIYSPQDKVISLYHKFSLVNILFAFRYHMQNCGLVDEMYLDDSKLDAVGWSMSIFKKATPKSWKRAVDNGMVMYK